MPVKVPASLPARSVLDAENVFLMDELRALHQDIRPLRIAILNLMPTKVATETQLLRLLGNTPLQLEVTLLHMASHDSKNTSAEHLLEHYVSFAEVRDQSFDGLIVTGAPVEQMPFEALTRLQRTVTPALVFTAFFASTTSVPTANRPLDGALIRAVSRINAAA